MGEGAFLSNNASAAQTRIGMEIVGTAGEATADLMTGEVHVRSARAGTDRLAHLYRFGLAAEASKRSASWETVRLPLPTT